MKGDTWQVYPANKSGMATDSPGTGMMSSTALRRARTHGPVCYLMLANNIPSDNMPVFLADY